MQWPPPRPRPSSAPTIVITSTPALLPLSHCWRSEAYTSPPVPMTCSLGRPRASATTSTNLVEPSSVTSTPGARPLGRREKAWMPSTMVAYTVTMSRSAKVNTVSRCIAARSLGMPATTTRSAAPRSNRAAATWVIAWGDHQHDLDQDGRQQQGRERHVGPAGPGQEPGHVVVLGRHEQHLGGHQRPGQVGAEHGHDQADADERLAPLADDRLQD